MWSLKMQQHGSHVEDDLWKSSVSDLITRVHSASIPLFSHMARNQDEKSINCASCWRVFTCSSATCSLSSCSLWRRTNARTWESRRDPQPPDWPRLHLAPFLWPSFRPWRTGPRAWTPGAGMGRRNPPGSCWSRSCATDHLERGADRQPIRATRRKPLKTCASSHLLFLLLKTDSVRSVSRSFSWISSRFLPAFQKSRVVSMMLSPPALLAPNRKWQQFKLECN